MSKRTSALSRNHGRLVKNTSMSTVIHRKKPDTFGERCKTTPSSSVPQQNPCLSQYLITMMTQQTEHNSIINPAVQSQYSLLTPYFLTCATLIPGFYTDNEITISLPKKKNHQKPNIQSDESHKMQFREHQITKLQPQVY